MHVCHQFMSMLSSDRGGVSLRTLPPPRPCSATLDLLQPFIKFLLLHPSPSLELAAARSLLYRELLSPTRRLPVDAAEGGNQPLPLPIVQLLVKLLPLQPLGTDDQLTSVAAMCRELVPAVMQTPGQGKAGGTPVTGTPLQTDFSDGSLATWLFTTKGVCLSVDLYNMPCFIEAPPSPLPFQVFFLLFWTSVWLSAVS